MLRHSTNIFLGVVALLVVAPDWSVAEEQYSAERYEVILDRSPFGEDPLAPEKMAEKEAAIAAQAMEKELRLCFLLENESGEVRAGFQNLKPKAGEPRSIILQEGESFNSMKLSDIDLDESSATLMLKGKAVTFTLKKAVVTKKAPTRAAPSTPTRRFGSGFRRTQPPATPPKQAPISPEEQARVREETRENLRQYQMEVIRAGMPPLPIPLTPEMDEQLVSEGVLPPSDGAGPP